jgi:hypothetical protein
MKAIYQAYSGYLRKINWTLLLFLVVVLNVKMLVKVPAIIILLLINRKMFLDKNIYRQKFIWFYFILSGIAILNVLINISTVSVNYLLAATTGIAFWLLAAAAACLNYRFVTNTDIVKLRATINLFFILNVAVTLVQLLYIMWDSGSVNPYTYQGMYQKYFINTGDKLTGITFDVSTTNAIINSFGVIFFLYSGKMRLTLICMATLLFTTSNFINILLGLALLLIFIFQSTKIQKSIIVICFGLLVIFMARISPQNNRYLNEEFNEITNKKKKATESSGVKIPLTQKPDSILTPEERKQKFAQLFIDSVSLERAKRKATDHRHPWLATIPIVPGPNIHSAPFQRKREVTPLQKELLVFAVHNIPGFDSSQKTAISGRVPGKLKAFKQTFQYLENHPLKIFAGAGTGNFASKLAFRTTGLPIAGSYPKKFIYLNNDFVNNHLCLYLMYFGRDATKHSLVNTPSSVYDQLIAEYGLAGLFAFVIFYLGFFVMRGRRLSYGLPIMLMMLVIFGMDYWYEQLSVVILFELLMLLNMKEIFKK